MGDEIKDKIKKLKLEIKNERQKLILNKKKSKRIIKDKEDGNILRRMSIKFFNKMEFLNEKRLENGLTALSLPERTELIIRHKNWRIIEEDIISFNKDLEVINE